MFKKLIKKYYVAVENVYGLTEHKLVERYGFTPEDAVHILNNEPLENEYLDVYDELLEDM